MGQFPIETHRMVLTNQARPFILTFKALWSQRRAFNVQNNLQQANYCRQYLELILKAREDSMIVIIENMFLYLRSTLTCIAKLGYYFNPTLSPVEIICFYNKHEMAVLGKPQVLSPGNRNWLSIFVTKIKLFLYFPPILINLKLFFKISFYPLSSLSFQALHKTKLFE